MQPRAPLLVHATLDNPHMWGYVFDKLEAEANFAYQMNSVCFFGHTHVPLAFEKAGIVRSGLYTKLKITAAATEPEKAASDTYKAFAGSYLETVKNLKNCAPAEAPAHFQRMTEACMNCHNAICPGPTKRIRKLL